MKTRILTFGPNNKILSSLNGVFVVTDPVITTASVTDISSSAAVCGGNVISDGDKPITERGVCWSTLSNPTTLDSKTSDGVGKGTFISNITGLHYSTTYYVRAYATNSVGTNYGEQRFFSTNEDNKIIYGGDDDVLTWEAITDELIWN